MVLILDMHDVFSFIFFIKNKPDQHLLNWFKCCSRMDRDLWFEKSQLKAMAPHSSTLAWRIPWTEEPGRLQSMGSLRVRHNWATLLSLFTFMHWRRKWQPTPVFLPGESQGQGEPGGLPSMGSHRVGHDWSNLAAVAVLSFSPNIIYSLFSLYAIYILCSSSFFFFFF